MLLQQRIRSATRAAAFHFGGTFVVALLAAALVFGLWFPFPYRELAGGRELFILIVVADMVCGPLLTMVLYNPAKPRAELWRDLGLVIVIQAAALGYGLYVVSEARPVYLVHEVDRFKVITAQELPDESLAKLPHELRPRWLGGPITVAIRDPKDAAESNTVLFESVLGGRDYADRPEFYIAYKGTAALKALKRARPLATFLDKHPSQRPAAEALATSKGLNLEHLVYLPVVGRQDWVALLNQEAQIQGFLKGDGFN